MDEVTEARRITRLIELREQLKTPTLSEKEEDEICREIFKLTGVRYPYPKRTVYVTKEEQEAFSTLTMWVSFEIEAQNQGFNEFQDGGKYADAYYSLKHKIEGLKTYKKIQ